jgi:tetratricopeptide (TPR) repeat protein
LDETHRRHLDYMVQLFSDAGVDWQGRMQPAGLRLGDAEVENLRVALDWSMVHEPERSLNLARAVSGYWFTHGAFRETRQRLAQTLANARAVADPVRAIALAEMGMHATTAGDFAAARGGIDAALDLYRQLDDGLGIGTCRFLLARLATWEGRLDDAHDLYVEAIPDLRRYQAATLPMALGNFGGVLQQRGELDRATAVLAEGLADAERQEAPWARMSISEMQGALALERGDHVGAREAFRRGLLLQRELQDPRYIAQFLVGAAWLAEADGNVHHAARLLGAASGLRASIGIEAMAPTLRHGRGSVEHAQSQIGMAAWEQAWEHGHGLSQADAIDVALR